MHRVVTTLLANKQSLSHDAIHRTSNAQEHRSAHILFGAHKAFVEFGMGTMVQFPKVQHMFGSGKHAYT